MPTNAYQCLLLMPTTTVYHCLLLLFTTGDHGEAAISGRLYDGVAQGALNVLLGRRILQETIAFGRELPWRNMTIVVDPVAFSARPAHAIETAVSAARARDGGAWLTRALALRARHAPDVLWSHPRSRVAGRVLDACVRVAEQSRRESG